MSSSTTNIPTTKNAASGPSRFLEGCAFDQFVDDFLPKVSEVIDHFTSGTAFRGQRARDAEEPSAVLARLHKLMIELDVGRFLTVFYGTWDPTNTDPSQGASNRLWLPRLRG